MTLSPERSKIADSTRAPRTEISTSSNSNQEKNTGEFEPFCAHADNSHADEFEDAVACRRDSLDHHESGTAAGGPACFGIHNHGLEYPAATADADAGCGAPRRVGLCCDLPQTAQPTRLRRRFSQTRSAEQIKPAAVKQVALSRTKCTATANSDLAA